MEAGIECLAYVVRWQKRKQLTAEKNDQDQEGESDTDVSLHLRPPFRDTEKCQPRQCDRDTEGALARLKEDIMTVYASCLNKTNTTREEQRALKELRNNNSIIVKPSDKCKGFMVLDRDTCIFKTRNILDVADAYEKLERSNKACQEGDDKSVADDC